MDGCHQFFPLPYENSLPSPPSRGGICFPSLWIWVGLVTCFDQQKVVEMVLSLGLWHQAGLVRTSELCLLPQKPGSIEDVQLPCDDCYEEFQARHRERSQDGAHRCETCEQGLSDLLAQPSQPAAESSWTSDTTCCHMERKNRPHKCYPNYTITRNNKPLSF